MIDLQKYVPTTLRKNRAEAFQKDLHEVFVAYSNQMDEENITLGRFLKIWKETYMRYIFQCRGEDEDEDEYAQLLYQVILKVYFLNQVKKSKVFCLFALYCSYYSCERKRKIILSKLYIDQLTIFLKENKKNTSMYFMKICYHLCKNCFSYGLKIGTRNPMLKSNGETFKKLVIVKPHSAIKINDISDELKQVTSILSQYQQIKEKVAIKTHHSLKDMKLDLTDKHFGERTKNIVSNFENYMEKAHDQSQ